MAPGIGADRLQRALHPRGVAVVGASTDPTKRGHQVVRALLDRGFAGPIRPVNPRGGEILGLTVALSVEEAEGPLDLAVICTPGPTVPEIVEACGRRGIAGAVALAAGFRELGEEGSALEDRVRDAARRTGVRVIGPNTSGLLNLPLGLDLIGVPRARSGRLALLAQSGNTALGLLNDAADRPGEGFSVVVGVGNETEVGFHEYLDVLGRDPNTGAILVHAESFSNGRAFLDVARRVTRDRPVVVLKGGRSRAGERAARSHTGAVATDRATVRAALRQAGVVEVTRSDDLLPVGRTLECQPAAQTGRGMVILADGGGHGTLAADHLEEMGVPLAPLASETRNRLAELLGSRAAVENPVDLAGAADRDPAVFSRTLPILLDDPAVSGVLLVSLFGGYAIRFAAELEAAERAAAREMADAARRAGKPLVVHSIYAESGAEPIRILQGARVPVLRSVETACRSAAATWQRGRLLKELSARRRGASGPARRAPGGSRGSTRVDGSHTGNGRSRSRRGRTRPLAAPASPILAARREGRGLLLEPEARALLAAYGIPLVPARLCAGPDAVRAAVRELGSPAVLKAVSGTVTHKTDAGGVELGVEGGADAVRALARIHRRVERYARTRDLDPDLRGVLVSPMLPRPEVELLVGIRRDRVFGPVLTLGAGGTAVEILEDVAVRVLPLGRRDVEEMVDQLRIAPLLRGYRGRPGVDLRALEALVLGLARCVTEQPEIMEIEVNPLFASADGFRGVDARAFLMPGPDARSPAGGDGGG